MRAFPILLGSALAAAVLAATQARAAPQPTSGWTPGAPGRSAAAYSVAVTRICAGAVLFDHAQRMGTRADALAVARDIRASTARRLARVTTLPVPLALRRISRLWISSQRLLAASCARTWVRIYDAIDSLRTPEQRAMLTQRLQQLVHSPDPFRLAAERLEVELNVPDCTGGDSGSGPVHTGATRS